MKKIIYSLIAVLAFCGYAYCESSDYPHGLSTMTQAQKSTAGFTVGEGDIAVQDEFMSYTGFMNMVQVFDDLPALSVTSNFNTAISTSVLKAAATTFTGGLITQPAHPFNIVAEVSFTAGEATTTVAGTLVVTGVNARGESATETITISTTQAAGNVAFASITSLAWTVTTLSGTDNPEASLQCGNGTKLGLANDIQAAGDVYQVIYDDSGTTADDAGYTLNTTYDTIIFSTTNDGTTDIGTVWYKVKKR